MKLNILRLALVLGLQRSDLLDCLLERILQLLDGSAFLLDLSLLAVVNLFKPVHLNLHLASLLAGKVQPPVYLHIALLLVILANPFLL